MTFSFINMYGQDKTLQTKISLPNNIYTVQQMTQSIQWQADLSFSYNSNKINSKQKIEIRNHQTDLVTLLHFLKSNYGITSRLVGSHVILIPNKDYSGFKKLKKESRRIKKKNMRKAKEKQEEDKIEIQQKNQVVTTDDRIANQKNDRLTSNDSIAFVQEITTEDDLLRQYYLELGDQDQLSGNINSLELRGTNRNNQRKFLRKLIVNVGAFADENFYLNPTLELGYEYVYVSGSYAMHNEFSHPRWGAGILIPFSKKMTMSVHGNYGRFERNNNYFYDFTPPPEDDSIPVIPEIYSGNYTTQGSLIKIGISFEYRFNKYISVTVAPVWNQLNTKFRSEGNSVSLISLFPADEVGIQESDVSLLDNKLLETGNTFSISQTEYVKSWFGIQAGIRIRLFGND